MLRAVTRVGSGRVIGLETDLVPTTRPVDDTGVRGFAKWFTLTPLPTFTSHTLEYAVTDGN